MALNLITNIGTELTLSSQWGDLSTLLDQVKTGIGNKIRVHSLTNWDSSTTKPAIAEGSLFDVGGSLYLADSDTALTDESGLIDGTCHIKLVPAVDGLTVTPTLTNDSIPAWDETKHGWYDGDDKFLPFEMTKASSAYSDKCEYVNQNKTVKVCDDGSAYLDGDLDCSTVNTGNGATEIYNMNQNVMSSDDVTFNRILISKTLRTDQNTTRASLYSTLSNVLGTRIPASCIISGTIGTNIISFAVRTSSTNIYLEGRTNTGAGYELLLTPTDNTAITDMTLCSGSLVL